MSKNSQNVVKFVKDGLTNLVANLGTDRDKASHSQYSSLTLTDDELINAYRFAWLPRKIVDIVSEDAVRNWRTWQVDKVELDKIETLERKLNLKAKVLEAQKKARLFGGCGIYIGTNQQDVSTPLSIDEVLFRL